MALATAKQLWRLNKEGRLALLARGLDVEPLTPEQADAAIKEKVEAGEAYDRRGIGGLVLPSVLTGSDLKQRRISSSASGNQQTHSRAYEP